MEKRTLRKVMSELARRKWEKGITEEEREQRREGGRKRQRLAKEQRDRERA